MSFVSRARLALVERPGFGAGDAFAPDNADEEAAALPVGAVVAVGTDDERPALVVVAEFRGPDEAGARSDLISRVASECGVVPAKVVFLAPGSLPRTSSGKLRRIEVKQNMEVLS